MRVWTRTSALLDPAENEERVMVSWPILRREAPWSLAPPDYFESKLFVFSAVLFLGEEDADEVEGLSFCWC